MNKLLSGFMLSLSLLTTNCSKHSLRIKHETADNIRKIMYQPSIFPDTGMIDLGKLGYGKIKVDTSQMHQH